MNMHPLNLSDEPTTAEPVVPASAVDVSSASLHNQAVITGQQPISASPRPMAKKSNPLPVLLTLLLTISLGVATGFGLNKAFGGGTLSGGTETLAPVATGAIKDGDVFGSADSSTFKDTAEGYLEAGGIEGEGSHRLVRPGGETQTVYLTSSVTDLTKLEGAEVKIWGETFRGQKAGWLMDVGRIEVLKAQGNKPE